MVHIRFRIVAQEVHVHFVNFSAGITCADPESFVRGASILTTFFCFDFCLFVFLLLLFFVLFFFLFCFFR